MYVDNNSECWYGLCVHAMQSFQLEYLQSY